MTRHVDSLALVTLMLVACTTTDPERSPPGSHEADASSESSSAATTMPADTGAASTATTASDDTDADATSSSPSSTSAADDTSGSEGMVECAGVCVSPPIGWSGPIVQREDGVCDLPGYEEVALDGYRDVSAPAATCGCECSVANEASCDASLVRYTSGTCAAVTDTFALHSGCNNIVDQTNGYFGLALTVSGGACEADASNDVAPVEILEELTLCGASEVSTSGCDTAEQCVPQHGEETLCWWKEGDVDCVPTHEGFLASRTVLFTEAPTDTRDCSECSCSDPDTTCSDPGVLMVTANQSCGFSDFPSPVGVGPDDCEQYTPHSVHMTAEPSATTECGVAEPSTPIGTVEPQGAVTVCCFTT